MIRAYIMITVDLKKMSAILKQLRKIKEISKIFVTAGEYDLIARVEVNTLEELYEVTEKIHEISGILKTITHVVEKEIRRRG